MPNISFTYEPALWIGVLTAIIDAVAVFFPSALTTEQKTALVGLVTVIVPLLGSVVVRQTSTPNAKLAAPTTPVAPAPPSVPSA